MCTCISYEVIRHKWWVRWYPTRSKFSWNSNFANGKFTKLQFCFIISSSQWYYVNLTILGQVANIHSLEIFILMSRRLYYMDSQLSQSTAISKLMKCRLYTFLPGLMEIHCVCYGNILSLSLYLCWWFGIFCLQRYYIVSYMP